MATAATRMVDLEIMIDMFGGCVCVCVCVFRGVCTCVCVLVCVDVDVYERIRKFSECQTGSEQRAFIVQGEDAYRGRLPRTPPCFSGAFSPVRARMGPRPIKARPFEPNGCRRGGEEARGRSGPVEKSPQPTSTHSSQPEGGSVPTVAYARSWPCLQQSYGYM